MSIADLSVSEPTENPLHQLVKGIQKLIEVLIGDCIFNYLYLCKQ